MTYLHIYHLNVLNIVLVIFHHCDKIPEQFNVKEKRHILAHNFNQWLLAPLQKEREREKRDRKREDREREREREREKREREREREKGPGTRYTKACH
jgi:hypothetical protein